MSSSFTSARSSSDKAKRRFRTRYDTRCSRWSSAMTWAKRASKSMVGSSLCGRLLFEPDYDDIFSLGRKGLLWQRTHSNNVLSGFEDGARLGGVLSWTGMARDA